MKSGCLPLPNQEAEGRSEKGVQPSCWPRVTLLFVWAGGHRVQPQASCHPGEDKGLTGQGSCGLEQVSQSSTAFP